MVPKHHHLRLTQGAATETKVVTLKQGTQWNMIVYWASNPFLEKFDIVWVEAGFFQIRSQMDISTPQILAEGIT